MTAPGSAFQFRTAGFDAGAEGGLVCRGGRVALVDGDVAIRQAILLLLSTVPGERVRRPEYGSELHRLIFASNDNTTAGLAIHYVRQAIRRWEPRVEVIEVDADPDPTLPGRLNIVVQCRVLASGSTQTLVYALDLDTPIGTGAAPDRPGTDGVLR
jgi:phage baseplate assembly protein W